MAAPQQITGGDTGGVAVFYAPPAGQAPNAGAQFLSAFVGQRVENAKQLLAMRLAALDPSARHAALADLARTRQANLAQIASTERQRISSAADRDVAAKAFYGELVKLHGIDQQVQGGLAEKRMELAAKRYEARALTPRSQEMLEDAQRALALAAQEYDQARQLPDESARLAATDEAHRNLIARMAATKRAALSLQSSDERDALAGRINDMVGAYNLNDEALQDKMGRIVANVFQRPPEIAAPSEGVSRASPEGLARTTSRVMELLGVQDGGGGSVTVERSTGSRGPASSPPPRQREEGSSPPVRDGASSGTRGTAPPAAGESSRAAPPAPAGHGSSDADLRSELANNDRLMRLIESYDPTATLGGIYDPYPGARPTREADVDMLRRVAERRPGAFRRLTGEEAPKTKMSLKDKVSQLLGKKEQEPDQEPASEAPKESPRLLEETGRPWSAATEQGNAALQRRASRKPAPKKPATPEPSTPTPPAEAFTGANPARLFELMKLEEENAREEENAAEVQAARDQDREHFSATAQREILEDRDQAREAQEAELERVKAEDAAIDDRLRDEDEAKEDAKASRFPEDNPVPEEARGGKPNPLPEEMRGLKPNPVAPLQDRIRELEEMRRKRERGAQR